MDISNLPVAGFGNGMGDQLAEPGVLFVPHLVWLEDDVVAWEWDDPEHPPRQPRVEGSNHDALAEFLSLEDGGAEDFLSFVQRYGPLLLCEHHLPVSHSRHEWMTDLDVLQRPAKLVYAHFHFVPRLTGEAPKQSCAPVQRETVAQIREWVVGLANLLRVGHYLTHAASDIEQFPGDVEELLAVWGHVRREPVSVGAARWGFGQRLCQLLELTGVQPFVEWGEKEAEPHLQMEGVGVLGLLVQQVLSVVAGGSDTRVCEACPQNDGGLWCHQP